VETYGAQRHSVQLAPRLWLGIGIGRDADSVRYSAVHRRSQNRIIDAAGDPSLDCGPPLISSAYEAKQQADAKAAVTRLGSDPPTLSAVEQRLLITAGPPFTDNQTMEIYIELLKLHKIQLVPVGTGFHFSYRALAHSATHDVQGSVARAGSVTVDQVGPSQFFSCPICLARGTLIATPVGPVPVEAVDVGMAVYTANTEGQRVSVTVVRIGTTRVSPRHRMLTIRLSDGRSVTASPNHPTAGDRPSRRSTPETCSTAR
jgi:hypothetical protein